jgi:hypothetical protein
MTKVDARDPQQDLASLSLGQILVGRTFSDSDDWNFSSFFEQPSFALHPARKPRASADFNDNDSTMRTFPCRMLFNGLSANARNSSQVRPQ